MIERMKILERKDAYMDINLPCQLCGRKDRTVSFYLEAEGKKRIPQGFYSDLSIRRRRND